MRRLIAGAAAALALGAVAYFATGAGAAPPSTFTLLDGTRQTTADLKGRVTLVSFWATKCTPCVGEMPKLVETYERYHLRGFDTVAVAMSYDEPDQVATFAETRRLPFKVALDDTGALAKAWGSRPDAQTTFLLNRRGEIVKRYAGEPDFVDLQQRVERLLGS